MDNIGLYKYQDIEQTQFYKQHMILVTSQTQSYQEFVPRFH